MQARSELARGHGTGPDGDRNKLMYSDNLMRSRDVLIHVARDDTRSLFVSVW